MAGIKKIFEPSELWGYYMKNQSEFQNLLVLIASHDNYGLEIFATRSLGQFKVEVHGDDVLLYEEDIVSAHDCNRTISRIYDEYLTDNVTSMLPDAEEDDEDDEEVDSNAEEIELREEELECLFNDLFIGILGTQNLNKLDDKVVEDIREHMLEYMARKHMIEIYRPMYLEDENGGEDFFVEYPYPFMVFEDEDNPMYK